MVDWRQSREDGEAITELGIRLGDWIWMSTVRHDDLQLYLLPWPEGPVGSQVME